MKRLLVVLALSVLSSFALAGEKQDPLIIPATLEDVLALERHPGAARDLPSTDRGLTWTQGQGGLWLILPPPKDRGGSKGGGGGAPATLIIPPTIPLVKGTSASTAHLPRPEVYMRSLRGQTTAPRVAR